MATATSGLSKRSAVTPEAFSTVTRSLSAVAAMTPAAGADMVIAIHATIPVATKWLLRTLICGVGFMGWAERRIEEGQSSIVR